MIKAVSCWQHEAVQAAQVGRRAHLTGAQARRQQRRFVVGEVALQREHADEQAQHTSSHDPPGSHAGVEQHRETERARHARSLSESAGHPPERESAEVEPGLLQRCAAHAASKTDAEEAFLAGEAAVAAAIHGETDKMVTLLRGDKDVYSCETGLAPLSDVANSIKKLPREWINEDGTSMNFQFLRYAQPLIQGEITLPHDGGVPVFARLEKVRVDKVLPAYEV